MCTKLSKEVTELLLQTPEEAEIERSEVLAELLEEKLKILNELNETILNVCDVKEIKIVEKNIENASSHILNNSPAFQAATTANNVTPPAGHFLSSLPKLPKLELPKFKGKLTDWNSFWDFYDSAIHSNPT